MKHNNSLFAQLYANTVVKLLICYLIVFEAHVRLIVETPSQCSHLQLLCIGHTHLYHQVAINFVCKKFKEHSLSYNLIWLDTFSNMRFKYSVLQGDKLVIKGSMNKL